MNPNESPLVIRNAYLFDPSNGIDYPGSIVVNGGMIEDMGPDLPSIDGAEIIDAGGSYIFPAFCDAHVHFRTPGQTQKEDLDSGSRAALAGGFTSVIQMPNTNPIIDSVELVGDLTRDEPIELRVMGAVTVGSEQRELVDFGALMAAGAVAFTEDGRPISEFVFMKAALAFSVEAGVPVVSHAEDESFGLGGVVRLGRVADSLMVPGWNPKRESAMVERDLKMAKKFGGHLHVCHVSTSATVDLLKLAKSKDIDVTAEVTPHHLSLTEDNVSDFGADAKMNPPLGTIEDREVLIEALKDGSIDIIATDHAPHTPEEKNLDLMRAPFGVIGLETSFPVIYTDLVNTGRIGLDRIIHAMTLRPRQIFGLERVGLFKGSRADLVLVDLDEKWVIDPDTFESKSRNCPFRGKEVQGRIKWTMYRGAIAWKSTD